MTTPKRKPVTSARFAATWHKRPWLTLSTIATAVAILSAIGPMALAALHYFTTHAEFVQHQRHDESRDAWQSVQMIRLETLTTRNRVNDCDIAKTGSKLMSSIERQACETYRNEYEQAIKRLEAARAEAMATTKEKGDDK